MGKSDGSRRNSAKKYEYKGEMKTVYELCAISTAFFGTPLSYHGMSFRLKKLSVQEAVEGNPDKQQYGIVECLCGCGRKFKRDELVNKKRIFYDKSCRYTYINKQIDAGEIQPDEWRNCLQCGKRFPVYTSVFNHQADKRFCNPGCARKHLYATRTKFTEKKKLVETSGPARWEGLSEKVRSENIAKIPKPTKFDLLFADEKEGIDCRL